jgi:hypothetical protein
MKSKITTSNIYFNYDSYDLKNDTGLNAGDEIYLFYNGVYQTTKVSWLDETYLYFDDALPIQFDIWNEYWGDV